GERQHDKAEADRVIGTPDYFERGDKAVGDSKEWEALRSQQRDERLAFFAEGKQAFREVRNFIFKEVRTEFREDWKEYYQAKRQGMDADDLAKMKQGILAEQHALLDARRDIACAELRDRRDGEYAELLLRHREEKAELSLRQEQGLRSPHLLDAIGG